MIKIGQGFDVHAFAANRPLIIGGVTIPHHMGLMGHSDADVLLHAIGDALLGAAALGDLGTQFPDSDSAYRNISSRVLLRTIREKIEALDFAIAHLDSTIIAQEPRLLGYIEPMRETIAKDLNIAIECVSVKAKTTEHLGFIGREEGIAALATVLLTKSDVK